MKFLAIFCVLFSSAVSLANGYVCTSGDYKVTYYDSIDQRLGNQKPPVMVVTANNSGTIAAMQDWEVLFTETHVSTILGGLTHAVNSGRFIGVYLTVYKSSEPTLSGLLTINSDNDTVNHALSCVLLN